MYLGMVTAVAFEKLLGIWPCDRIKFKIHFMKWTITQFNSTFYHFMIMKKILLSDNILELWNLILSVIASCISLIIAYSYTSQDNASLIHIRLSTTLLDVKPTHLPIYPLCSICNNPTSWVFRRVQIRAPPTI